MKYSKDLINLLLRKNSLTLNKIKKLYFCKTKSVNVFNAKCDELNNVFMILLAESISKENDYIALKSFDSFVDCFQDKSHKKNIEQKIKKIAITIVRYLLENGYAYPSFETDAELEFIKSRQAMLGVKIGFYGSWACYRDQSKGKIIEYLMNKKSYVIRFRAQGNNNNFIPYGSSIHMPDDVILINKNKTPTKFFKQLIFDLFNNTAVSICQEVNSEQELIKKQIFKLLHCKYYSIIQINKLKLVNYRMKEDNYHRLKYYQKYGYPIDVLKQFLITIIHNNHLSFKHMALTKTKCEELKVKNTLIFDVNNFNKFSTEYFSNVNVIKETSKIINWVSVFKIDIYIKLIRDVRLTNKYLRMILYFIKKRKDVINYCDIFSKYGYVFHEIFQNLKYEGNFQRKIKFNNHILKALKTVLIHSFSVIRKNCGLNIFTEKVVTEYESYNDDFIGKITERDVMHLLRFILTKQNTGPDLKDLMLVFGKKEVCKRLEMFCDYFKVKL